MQKLVQKPRLQIHWDSLKNKYIKLESTTELKDAEGIQGTLLREFPP